MMVGPRRKPGSIGPFVEGVWGVVVGVVVHARDGSQHVDGRWSAWAVACE